MKKRIQFQILLFFTVFICSFAVLDTILISTNRLSVLKNLDYNLKQSATITEVFEWNKIWNNGSDEWGIDIALDSSDNSYIAGYSSGGEEKVYILKHNNTGHFQFDIEWPTNQLEIGTGVALDSQDNIYFIAGVFNDSTSDYNITLVKYDNSGNYQWNVSWGEPSYEVGWDLSVDNSDNVYIIGDTGGNGGDLFIVKFNSSGHYQWHDIFGGMDRETGSDITYDSSGNIYIVGSLSNFTSMTSDMLLVCYDQNGNHQWNNTWDISNSTGGSGIALDSSNNIYAVGTFNNSITGDFDVVLACFDNDGNFEWNQTWATSGYDYGKSITIDSQDHIYITGMIVNYTAYNSDLLILNYDNSGNNILERIITGTPETLGLSITVDSSDNIYVTGCIGNSSLDGYDIFLGKINPELIAGSTPDENGDDDGDDNGDENGQKILGFDLILFLGMIFICSTIIIRKIRKSINK